MTDESTVSDPYATVIADLLAKREQIDQAIRLLEALRGNGSPLTVASVVGASSTQVVQDGPGTFLGMTIPDAARKLLAMRKRTLSNSEIVAEFKRGGLVMQSADPMNTVGSVLTRRFNVVGDVVRVGRGTWGLAEWYPNRSFKKSVKALAAASQAAEPTDETSEPEQPSAPISGDPPA